VVQPVEKKLACGTTGMGAMAEVSDIAEAVRKYGSEKPA
jgi:phosphopantothenoylcysteine synthetase/decarboxylase